MVTINNKYLLHWVDDLFDKLKGSRYISKIDLWLGYHTLRVRGEYVTKIAFQTSMVTMNS